MSTTPRLYLDWNATTPPAEEVVVAMERALRDAWGNPSSVHAVGRRAREVVEDAREAVAALLALDPRDVLLTSGGTEANNIALELAVADVPAAIVVSSIEHPSVLRPAEHLASRGVEVLWVPPSPEGVIHVAAVEAAIARSAAPVRLVALQAVNHETGVVQPVAAVAEVAHRAGALLHCDAVQGAGKLGPAAWEGADLVSIAAHKIRGPKGIGALATRPGVRLRPVLWGGAQERGLRPGTVDGVAAAGLAAAAARAVSGPTRWEALAPLRDTLEAALSAIHARAVVHGAAARRAPHVTSLSFPGWRGAELVAALDLEGVSVSSGSACSAGTAEPSAVVAAMAGAELARAAVRVSLGEGIGGSDVQRAVDAFRRVLSRAASAAG